MKLAILLTFLLNTAYSFPLPIMAWNTIYNQNGIAVSYDIKECLTGMNILCVKLDNNTTSSKNVHFKIELRDGNGPVKDVLEFNQYINANSSKIGDCSDQSGASSLNKYLATRYSNLNVSITML